LSAGVSPKLSAPKGGGNPPHILGLYSDVLAPQAPDDRIALKHAGLTRRVVITKNMPKSELAIILATFPDMAPTIRRLYLADAGFRDLCSDYALAQTTLDRFSQRTDANQRPEISEYRDIICDLESDIAEYLQRKKQLVQGG
jgi:hypothetical protein